MDIVKLYQEYNVSFQEDGHKHCRPGWVNTECPFCSGNPGLHLGYSLFENYYFCWRCGWHHPVPTISALANLPETTARKVIRQYGGQSNRQAAQLPIKTKPHRLPSDTSPMTDRHKAYLSKRNFNPDQLERDWRLLGTSPISKLDDADYKHRILAPILWNEQQVSFQTRDITDKSDKKYKVCLKDREILPHKDIVYGKQEKWTERILCVEGVTDVWRFGPNSVATFGIKYMPAQVIVMAAFFKRVGIVFDPETQAIKQAKKLEKELLFRGVDAFRIKLESDPGDLSQSEADYIVKDFMKNRYITV